MRIAIVDDLETERAQLKTRLARQLRLCGAKARSYWRKRRELSRRRKRAALYRCLSGYLHARDERHGRCKGAAQNGRRLPSGFYRDLNRPRAGGLSGPCAPLSREALFRGGTFRPACRDACKTPRPEPVLTVKVSGSDVRLCYRDIISAEHFAHMINIRTTARKTLITRQSF